MDKTIWVDILIAFFAALLTWFFNRLTIITEIKKAKKDRINESRLQLYTECYEFLEQNIADNNVIFQKEYIDNLFGIKAKMKLVASNNVLKAFKVYYECVVNAYEDYRDFCIQNDPTSKVHIEIQPDGTKFEVSDFNEQDLEHYEILRNEYISNSYNRLITVKPKAQNILNAMRSDLGNDDFKDDFPINLNK